MLSLRHAEMETCLNLIQFGFTSQATTESTLLGPKGVGGAGFLSLRAKMISKWIVWPPVPPGDYLPLPTQCGPYLPRLWWLELCHHPSCMMYPHSTLRFCLPSGLAQVSSPCSAFPRSSNQNFHSRLCFHNRFLPISYDFSYPVLYDGEFFVYFSYPLDYNSRVFLYPAQDSATVSKTQVEDLINICWRAVEVVCLKWNYVDPFHLKCIKLKQAARKIVVFQFFDVLPSDFYWICSGECISHMHIL